MGSQVPQVFCSFIGFRIGFKSVQECCKARPVSSSNRILWGSQLRVFWMPGYDLCTLLLLGGLAVFRLDVKSSAEISEEPDAIEKQVVKYSVIHGSTCTLPSVICPLQLSVRFSLVC